MASDIGYLDDIALELEILDDHFEKSIPRYEYPYVDGADLDDMGEKARSIRVRCHFWDEGDHLTYDNREVLVSYLKKRNDFEFIHPEDGLLYGKVESVDIHYDDSERAAAVDFTFIEQMRTPPVAWAVFDVDTQAEGNFQAARDQQNDQLVTDLVELYLDPSAPVTAGTTLLSQLKGISARARANVWQIQNFVGRLNAWVNEVTQPVNSLVASIDYGTALPAYVLGAVDRCVERTARLYDSLSNAPSRYVASLDAGLDKLQADLDGFLDTDRQGGKAKLMKHLTVACARRLALETAYIYAADADARRTEKGAAAPDAFDTLGRYTPRTSPDVIPMNVNELEDTLATARTRLQEAIDAARDIQGLQGLALTLEQSVSATKQSAEKVTTVTPEGELPLHLLCLRQGLSYSDTERVMALNPALRNPTFVSQSVQLYVR